MLSVQQLQQAYSNEQVFIVLLARLYFLTTTTAEVQDFADKHPFNWKLLYKIAKAHGLRPFVYYVLHKYKINVDTNFKTRVFDDYKFARWKNLQKAALTARLIKDFQDLNITAIPYKGSVFIHQYYEDIGLRESQDIDFIIDRKDAAKIEDYFIANGYIPKETVPRNYLNYHQAFFKDLVYSNPAYGCAVELHWNLTNRFAGSYPSYLFFSPHLKPYQLDTFQVNTLQPAYDFLAIASNHFVKDMFIKFKYITDVACMLRKYPSLYKEQIISSTAEKYTFRKRLDLGLSLVNDLTGVSFNPSSITPTPSQYLATPLHYPVFLSRLQFNDLKFVKRSLQLQDTFINKVKFIARSFLYMFIPSYIDINTFKLPVFFLPVIAVARPFRLLLRKIRLNNKNYRHATKP